MRRRRSLGWQCGLIIALCACCFACGGPSSAAKSVASKPVTPTPVATFRPDAPVIDPPTATPKPTKTATATPPNANPTATTVPATPNQDFINRAIARTNSYRQQHGCAPLAENAKLDQAALGHSQDMAVHNYFAHNSPSGQTPWDRIHAAGYNFSSAAENIAAGYTTPESVIDAFYNEQPPNDGHRLNLLNCGLHDVGIGYYYYANSTYKTYWTQDFGTSA